MNYEFNDHDKAMRSRLKRLFGEDGLPTAAELAEAGYLSLGGDKGANSVSLVAAREVVAANAPSLFLSVEAGGRVFGSLLAEVGAEGYFLVAVRKGAAVGAVVPGGGGITATVAGAGLGLSGSARGVLNGPIADFLAVPVRLGDEAFVAVVGKGADGFSTGERESTLGFTGAAFSTISFDGCSLPEANVFGPTTADIEALLATWQDDIHTAAALGIMQRCYDAAREHAKDSGAGGKPQIARQEVAFPLAEMLTLLDTSQLLAYRAAWLAESGDHEARVVGRAAKVFCTESALEVAGHALRILGEEGQVAGNPAEQGFRDSQYLQVAGTSVVQSRLAIGDALLG